jgi:transposase
MALSQDLRHRIVDLVNSGTSRRQAARHFQVSVSSAIRFARQAKETGHVEVAPRKKRKSRLDPFHDIILAWIAAQPDLTLAEMSARFTEEHDMRVPVSTLDDWLRARQMTYKKNRTRQ